MYDDWALKLIEWLAPVEKKIQDTLRPFEFLSIRLNPDKCLYQDQESVTDIIVTLPDQDKLSIFFPTVKNSGNHFDTDVYNKMIIDFVQREVDENIRFETFDDFDYVAQMRKFVTRFNCRNVLGFNRVLLPPFQSEKPLPRGLFKGNYGSHGIELIMVNYSPDDKLEGVKVTGDPNVPTSKVTFRADLKKAIAMSREEQENLTCDELMSAQEVISYQVIDFKSDKDQPLPQPFIVPSDAFERNSNPR